MSPQKNVTDLWKIMENGRKCGTGYIGMSPAVAIKWHGDCQYRKSLRE